VAKNYGHLINKSGIFSAARKVWFVRREVKVLESLKIK
jgi:hypothetical protein